MTKRNVALIMGVTGQYGSDLSEFLLAKDYEVHGIIRRSSVDCRERIAHLEGKPNFHLHYADVDATGKKELGWNPQKTTFEELVKLMVENDMRKVAADCVASQVRTNLAEYLEKGLVK
jgi:GDP-D-mannose dehydratase